MLVWNGVSWGEGLRVESKPWRERKKKRRDGIEGWAEDGKEGRGASCSSVTCILVPGEAERRSAQTFAGAFSRRKKDGGDEGEGRRGKKIQRTWFLMVWVCRRAKRSKF